MALLTNSNSATLPVTLGNGQRISMNVNPSEVFFDANGYVWMFSLRFNDGEVGNFFLLKKTSSRSQVIDFFERHFVPLGLKIVGGKVQKKYEENEHLPAINVAVYLANKYGPGVINKITDGVYGHFHPDTWGYYELGSGELVFDGVVQIDAY